MINNKKKIGRSNSVTSNILLEAKIRRIVRQLLKEEDTNFKIKTVSQILKDPKFLDIIRLVIIFDRNWENKDYSKKKILYYSKFVLLLGEVTDDNFNLFLKFFKPKAKKLSTNPKIKEALLTMQKEAIKSNSYNTRLPSGVIPWVIKLLSTASLNTLLNFDGYKLYQDLDIKETTKYWTTRQGANMTTDTFEITLTLDNTEYTKEFENTSGYWNE